VRAADPEGISTPDTGGWNWFPWGILRSAGFPVTYVAPLRSERLVRAADALMASRRDLARGGTALVEQLRVVSTGPQRRRLSRAVKSRRPIHETPESGDLARDVENWNTLLDTCAGAHQMFLRAYERERSDSTARLLRVLDDDGVRRALLWQNPQALPFLLKAKDKQDERTLLKYLTRYATKNDTIGFFGPVVWIRVANERGQARCRVGPHLTRRTLLSFEAWPVAAIAERLAEDDELRSWLAPRRAALCRVQDGTVCMPPDCAIDAGARAIDILRLCDGRRSAGDIARTLGLDGLTELDALRRAGLITWTVACPMRTNPESALEELAARIDNPDRRETVQSHARWLSGTREHLREQMDVSASLAMALTRADSEFEQRYARKAVQGAGQYYAGRTLTYIDCERDVSLTLGTELLTPIMQGVSPLLRSLRWYTYTIVQRFLPALADLVPYGQARPLAAVFPGALGLVWAAIEDTAARYRRTWQQLVALDPTRRLVRVDPAALAANVETAFAAPHPGWPLARVHNPDILIAAEDHAELARGAGTIVLGEIHASLPSMFQAAVFSLCPEQERVRQQWCALVTPPPVMHEVSQRLNLGEFFSEAAPLLLPDEPVAQIHAKPIADFDLTHGERGLRVEDVTSHRRWSIPVFFDAMLSRSTFHVDPFDRPDDVHSPRIVVGEVVVARETWRVTAGALGLAERRRADPDDDAKTFLAVRRWAHEHDVPRYVFAKSAKEPKPMFLDLESQKCVDLLSHLLKRAALGHSPGAVAISEMLPEPDRCWLRDGAGRRYTSELRLLAVDPVPYPEEREAPEAELR
jgi:hypothetical protein